MEQGALEILRQEHRALAALLQGLPRLLAQARQDARLPDFALLRALLFCVDEVPERAHHPRESQLLFPLLRQRCPELAPVLARLDDDHDKGEREVRALQHRLLAFELLGEPRRAAFERAAETYVAAYLEHMACEERELLPAAQRAFAPEDWQALDQAFAAWPAPPDAAALAPLLARLQAQAALVSMAPHGCDTGSVHGR